LENLLARESLPQDWKKDVQQGLRVITSRVEALNRFMGAYSRLARLPQPKLELLDLKTLVDRVLGLETRMKVAVQEGRKLSINADADQLEQVLINLVRNAVEAAIETGGGVDIGWKKNGSFVEILIQDEGPGLANTTNLFVPFFTTKAEGSGIGLVVSRQIAEAHGGRLTLSDRDDTSGCQARLSLPLA